MDKIFDQEEIFIDSNINKRVDTLLWIREKVKNHFGINSVAIFYNGRRIDDIKGRKSYCDMVKNDYLNSRKCKNSSYLAEIKTLTKLKPTAYTCYGGLINFTIPIIYKKDVEGVLICGMFRAEDNETAVSIKRISDDFIVLDKNSNLYKLYLKEEPISYSSLNLLIKAINRYVSDLLLGATSEEDIPFRLSGTKKINRSINKVLEYIYYHVEENVSLEKVAEIAGLSTFYFCKMFKKAVGVGFSHYVRMVKIEQAKVLLDDESIKIREISKRLGFNENNYFTRVFKETTGMTPREYRKRAVIGI